MVRRNTARIVPLVSARAKKTGRNEAWDLSRLAQLRLYGDEFAFNTATGMLHRVSPTAGFILRELKSGRNSADVVARLRSLYGVSQSRAERDIELFFSDLATLGLIETRSRPSASRVN